MAVRVITTQFGATILFFRGQLSKGSVIIDVELLYLIQWTQDWSKGHLLCDNVPRHPKNMTGKRLQNLQILLECPLSGLIV